MKKEKTILKERERFEEELIEEVESDYLKRREERLPLERQWELNLNFFNGNQYSGLSNNGEIIESDKEYFWQSRGVFNHIAPIIEARLAKFTQVKPVLSVRPASNDAKEIENATLAEALLASSIKKLKLDDTISEGIRWSEICGTGFYKIVWDNNGGEKIGVTEEGEVFEGEVDVVAVSPFEIFPDSPCLSQVRRLPQYYSRKKNDYGRY